MKATTTGHRVTVNGWTPDQLKQLHAEHRALAGAFRKQGLESLAANFDASADELQMAYEYAGEAAVALVEG